MDLDDLLLRDVGGRIAELRRDAGLTQSEFALRAHTNLKHVQRIEAGQENLTLRTLSALAVSLGVEVASLFRPPLDTVRRRGRPPAAQEKRVIGRVRVSPSTVLTRAIPMLTLIARAGPADTFSDASVVDWITVSGRSLRGDIFAARIIGDSMAPRAPDGTICLFRVGAPRSLDGALVLIELDVSLGGGRYIFKRLCAAPPLSSRPRAYRVESINSATPPSDFEFTEESDARVVAEFVEALRETYADNAEGER